MLHIEFLVGNDLTVKKFRETIYRRKFDFVHYAGHTSANGKKWAFADRDVSTKELCDIFKKNPPFFAFINACESLGRDFSIAKDLSVSPGILVVIGTTHEIDDENIRIPMAFSHIYNEILTGKTIGKAVNTGLSKLELDDRHRIYYQLLADPTLRAPYYRYLEKGVKSAFGKRGQVCL